MEIFSKMRDIAFAPDPRARRIGVLGSCLLALAGCAAVGPNFQAPEAPRAQRYTEAPLAPQTASADSSYGAAQRYAQAGQIPADWWALFRSEALSKLVRTAIAGMGVEHRREQLPHVTASIGFAVFPLHGRSSDELFRQADSALYLAKKAGRDRVMAAGEEAADEPFAPA